MTISPMFKNIFKLYYTENSYIDPKYFQPDLSEVINDDLRNIRLIGPDDANNSRELFDLIFETNQNIFQIHQQCNTKNKQITDLIHSLEALQLENSRLKDENSRFQIEIAQLIEDRTDLSNQLKELLIVTKTDPEYKIATEERSQSSATNLFAQSKFKSESMFSLHKLSGFKKIFKKRTLMNNSPSVPVDLKQAAAKM